MWRCAGSFRGMEVRPEGVGYEFEMNWYVDSQLYMHIVQEHSVIFCWWVSFAHHFLDTAKATKMGSICIMEDAGVECNPCRFYVDLPRKHPKHLTYCGWKKSYTTWDVWNLIKWWDKLPTSTGELAGFLKHQQYEPSSMRAAPRAWKGEPWGRPHWCASWLPIRVFFPIYIQTSLRVQQNLKPSDFPMFFGKYQSCFFFFCWRARRVHMKEVDVFFICLWKNWGCKAPNFSAEMEFEQPFWQLLPQFCAVMARFTAGAMRFFWPYNCCTWECAFAFGRGNCSYETLQQDDELMRYCTMWHFAIQCVEGSLNRAFIKNSVKLTYPKTTTRGMLRDLSHKEGTAYIGRGRWFV